MEHGPRTTAARRETRAPAGEPQSLGPERLDYYYYYGLRPIYTA